MPTSMTFTVAGAWTYTVRLGRDLRDPDGKPLLGRTDQGAHTILINTAVERAVRGSVLLHELRHAWFWHVPRPTTDEEECNFASTFTRAYMNDLLANGGPEALFALREEGDDEPDPDDGVIEKRSAPADGLRYVAPDQVEEFDCRALPAAGRGQCKECGTLVGSGAIVTDPRHWDGTARGYVVVRRLYCAHCQHVQVWHEAVGFDGLPNGQVTRPPWLVTGTLDVERFLGVFREAAGVMVG